MCGGTVLVYVQFLPSYFVLVLVFQKIKEVPVIVSLVTTVSYIIVYS